MKSDILHIIKTKSLSSDGRLLKWLESLNNNNIQSTVFILEDEHSLETKSILNAKVYNTKLFFRRLFKQRRGYIFKIPEYSFKSYFFIKKSSQKTVVFHDMQHYFTFLLFIIFGKNGKTFIWDMHELPHSILFKFQFTRWLLKIMLEEMNLLIYTNEERRNYVIDKMEFNEKLFLILNNFPNSDFIKKEKSSLPDNLKIMLDEKPYILWMGQASLPRNFDVMYEAYSNFKQYYKLIIVGNIDNDIKERISKDLKEGLIFQTFVPQSELINYIDNAALSVVLYKSNIPNNKFCEPNRLYQLIARKIPVICGNNPPMKSIVHRIGAGIVLLDDGSNSNLLTTAIFDITKNRMNYIKNLNNLNMEGEFSWDNQFSKVTSFLNT